MIITRRTVLGCVVSASTALWLPWRLSLLLMGLVLAAAAADGWQVREPPTLDRRLPALLSRGVPARFEIVSTGRWPRLRLRQPIIPDIRLEPQEAASPLAGEITAARRGHHLIPPTATHSTGPLGLGGWVHRVGDGHAVTVYPDMPTAHRLAVAVRTGQFREEGKRSRGPLGLGTDFESIREYRPDDDVRQINWKATVKKGAPMSNQYRMEQDRDVICVIDCGRLMAAPLGGKTRLDIAVDAAAAVAAVADEVGDRVGVVAFDTVVRRHLAPRRDGGSIVARAIFDLEPSPVDADFAAAFHRLIRAKRAFVIVFTDLLDEVAARPLLGAIPLLARKHAVTVAGVRDSEIDAHLTRPAETEADVIRAAVAVKMLQRRETAAAALTHRGVQVVEAAPEGFSARCVAAYLRAKRSARS